MLQLQQSKRAIIEQNQLKQEGMERYNTPWYEKIQVEGTQLSQMKVKSSQFHEIQIDKNSGMQWGRVKGV